MINTEIRLIISCSQKWKSSIQSAKTRPGADCGTDHEHHIAKFRFKLKKVGKITRPFRHDLNQIPYDYTPEVRNRFKGLDLIYTVPDELWKPPVPEHLPQNQSLFYALIYTSDFTGGSPP